MDTTVIVAIVIAFLVVDAIVMLKVFGGARRAGRARPGTTGLGDPGSASSALTTTDDWAARQALAAAGTASPPVMAAVADELAHPEQAVPGEAPAEEPALGAPGYQSGFENPAPGHPGGSEDVGWSLGGGWSDTSSSSDSDSGSSDSGASDAGSSSSD